MPRAPVDDLCVSRLTEYIITTYQVDFLESDPFLCTFVNEECVRVPEAFREIIDNLCRDAHPLSAEAVVKWLSNPSWPQWPVRKAQIIRNFPSTLLPEVREKLKAVLEYLDMVYEKSHAPPEPLSNPEAVLDALGRELLLLANQIYRESKKGAFAPPGARIPNGDPYWVGRFSRPGDPALGQKPSFASPAVAWRSRDILARKLAELNGVLKMVPPHAITPGVEKILSVYSELGTKENATLFAAFSAAAVAIFKRATGWTDHLTDRRTASQEAAVELPDHTEVLSEVPPYTLEAFPTLPAAEQSSSPYLEVAGPVAGSGAAADIVAPTAVAPPAVAPPAVAPPAVAAGRATAATEHAAAARSAAAVAMQHAINLMTAAAAAELAAAAAAELAAAEAAVLAAADAERAAAERAAADAERAAADAERAAADAERAAAELAPVPDSWEDAYDAENWGTRVGTEVADLWADEHKPVPEVKEPVVRKQDVKKPDVKKHVVKSETKVVVVVPERKVQMSINGIKVETLAERANAAVSGKPTVADLVIAAEATAQAAEARAKEDASVREWQASRGKGRRGRANAKANVIYPGGI